MCLCGHPKSAHGATEPAALSSKAVVSNIRTQFVAPPAPAQESPDSSSTATKQEVPDQAAEVRAVDTHKTLGGGSTRTLHACRSNCHEQDTAMITGLEIARPSSPLDEALLQRKHTFSLSRQGPAAAALPFGLEVETDVIEAEGEWPHPCFAHTHKTHTTPYPHPPTRTQTQTT